MAREEWLTDEDEEPDAGTVVRQKFGGAHWVRGKDAPEPWTNGKVYSDWETIAGPDEGPVTIVRSSSS